ncbi:unnamed protein product [Cuscuta europaea]|uniref:Uncharacterized protein n=1 Tax=Cuscuta europaea TaxID=41803 RepID=A0A9P1DYK3_CUSEU|nr:unnamed protein product [Cuscuta europaea]
MLVIIKTYWPHPILYIYTKCIYKPTKSSKIIDQPVTRWQICIYKTDTAVWSGGIGKNGGKIVKASSGGTGKGGGGWVVVDFFRWRQLGGFFPIKSRQICLGCFLLFFNCK